MSDQAMVRHAKLADLEAIERIDRSTFSNMRYPKYVLRQLYDVSSQLLFVASVGGDVCGYTIGALAFEGKVGWILSLAVEEHRRGHGIGNALTTALLNKLAARGCDIIRLTVQPGNSGALSLYSRLNFAEIGYEVDYFGPGEPRIVMELSLLRQE